MVTKAPDVIEDPSEVEQFVQALETGARVALAGSPVGAIRRIILYLVAGAALALGLMPIVWVALILLIATDSYV